MTEPVGKGKDGRDVYLGDIWPSTDEVHKPMKYAMNGKAFRANYEKVTSEPGKLWEKIKGVTGATYTWPQSTYIAEPPFFKTSSWRLRMMKPKAPTNMPYTVRGSWRCLAIPSQPTTSRQQAPSRKPSPGQWLLRQWRQKSGF